MFLQTAKSHTKVQILNLIKYGSEIRNRFDQKHFCLIVILPHRSLRTSGTRVG